MKQLAEFKDKLYVRVFKAAIPGGFRPEIGAIGEFYELPFKALRYLFDEGIYVAVMTDGRVMPREEILIHMLDEMDPGANYLKILEEGCRPL
ncbi:MAG: hypothetical protein QXM67_05325 [Candidatus Methanomethylicia archaeon]